MVRISILWLSLLFSFLLGWSGSSQAVDPIAEKEAANQLLVLQNGNILQGKIIRMGDHYHVVNPHGEMWVPVGQVDRCCANLEEAYLEQRASRTGRAADSHLQLAKWCLRHELLDYARRELSDARAIDPLHPGGRVLERQIAQVARAKKHSSNREKIQQKSPGIATSELLATRGHASDSKLTADLAKIPQAARAQFVRQIEPLLLHHCATSGCHQPNSPQKFRLDRLALIGFGHPRMTRRNLAAVLEQLEAESKDANSKEALSKERCPLLSYAAVTHGATSESESVPLDTKKLQLLRDWAKLLATQDDRFQHRQPLSTADNKNRLMKRWDKSSGPNIPNSTVIRRASAPIFYHPSQTITVQE